MEIIRPEKGMPSVDSLKADNVEASLMFCERLSQNKDQHYQNSN